MQPPMRESQNDPAERGQCGIATHVSLSMLGGVVIRGAIELDGDSLGNEGKIEVRHPRANRDAQLPNAMSETRVTAKDVT